MVEKVNPGDARRLELYAQRPALPRNALGAIVKAGNRIGIVTEVHELAREVTVALLPTLAVHNVTPVKLQGGAFVVIGPGGQ